MIHRLRRRLSRLRVSQRLALLVLIPLAAVVGLAIPVVTDRADRAQAQASIADEAETRRTVGVLLEELQRERLLTLLYLALPDAESSPVVRQSQAANDAIDAVRTDADPRLRPAVDSVVELLGTLRARVLDNRSVLSMVAHQVFSDAIAEVIDAIPPATAAGTDASLPPAAALDELLRANEQAARLGTAVLVRVTEPVPGQRLQDEAETALKVHTDRFGTLASANQRNLLTLAENSQAAGRVNALVESPSFGELGDAVSGIASAVETYTTLRRLVGDRIAREITDEAASDANAAFTEAVVVGLLALLLLLVVAAMAAAGARSIAVPLAQLNAAAIAVAAATGRELERVSDVENQSESTPALRAVPTTGPGDVADLAAAFNQVQEGAAALLARQVTTRRNVSAMFATVARRTRNLADRQLNLIDVLERQQQDPQLLERLYRLDHVATRLRRSASALLVVSGAADDPATGPMRLADVVRAAAAEIEQFTRVRLEDAIDVAAVPRVVSDLILLVAELLDNAVSYSPPPGPVAVSVSVLGEGCRISIADVGIGMSAEQLAAENKRLVDRERLEIAPTRVLGLFVVGRLARRHNLTVTLQGNQPQGVVAYIDLPARLLTAPVGVTAPAPQPRGLRQAVRTPAQLLPVPERTASAMRAVVGANQFDWFGDPLPALTDGTPMPGGIAPRPLVRGVQDTAPLTAFDMPRAGRPPSGPAAPVPSPLVPPSVASGPIVPLAAARPAIPVEPVAGTDAPDAAGAGVGGVPALPPAPPIRPGSLRDRPQRSGDQPGPQQGDAAQPGTGQPATGQPGIAEPGLPQRGSAQQGSAQSGAAQPGIGQPGTGEPGLARNGAQPVEERGGLSRRVPGRNLPSGLGPAEQRMPDPVDPAAAKAEADAFSQGFARGVASVPGSMRPSETPGPAQPAPDPRQASPEGLRQRSPEGPWQGPPDGLRHGAPEGPWQGPREGLRQGSSDGPSEGPQSAPPPQWPLSAAIPAQREPHSAERIGSAPVSSAPVSSAPVSSAPVSPAPTSGVPVSGVPVSGAPISGAPVSALPAAAFDDTGAYPLPSRRVPGQTRNGWAGDDTRSAPTVAAGAASPDDGALTRRVPGSHLASELRSPGAVQRAPDGMPPMPARAQVPLDRDPQAEQLQLNALFAGFARGDAADEPGNGAPDRGPTLGPFDQPPPSYQYDSGVPNGAEPQNVER